jgi:hypothetical protein
MLQGASPMTLVSCSRAWPKGGRATRNMRRSMMSPFAPWFVRCFTLCALLTGCGTDRIGSPLPSEGQREFIKVDDAYELWRVGCRLREEGKVEAAFAVFRALVQLRPGSEWAVKARGELVHERYRPFYTSDTSATNVTGAVSRNGEGMKVHDGKWRGLKYKAEVRERFGAPDEIVPDPQSKWKEKWIYRGRLEVRFLKDWVIQMDEMDENGPTGAGSMSFIVDPIE